MPMPLSGTISQTNAAIPAIIPTTVVMERKTGMRETPDHGVDERNCDGQSNQRYRGAEESKWHLAPCALTKQANRRPAAAAKPRMRDVGVEQRVRQLKHLL